MAGLHDASWVDRAIREAQERGEFDNLPGAGKPLRDIDTSDPNWWLKSYAEREGLDLGDALPAPMLLRKEAAGYPASVLDIASEKRVREILADYNRRARAEIMRPFFGKGAPPLVKYLDIDEVTEQWREQRAAVLASRGGPGEATHDKQPMPPTADLPARARSAWSGLWSRWRRHRQDRRRQG